MAVAPMTLSFCFCRTINRISLFSKRMIASCAGPSMPNGVLESYLRQRTSLSITHLISSEWCEKQMEYSLTSGLPKRITPAMRAGIARHRKLDQKQVTRKVKVHLQSAEDRWALKFLNFITRANQLLIHGLTRELPLVSRVGGQWVVGIADEILNNRSDSESSPVIADTKTRVRATLPSEPQRRNGRFQLMCYKNMWDSLVSGKFSLEDFCDSFSLNPNGRLSPVMTRITEKAGFPSKTLNILLEHFQRACSSLPMANDQLIIRYESQKDQSLIGEYQFNYDKDWVEGQLRHCLEFWQGKREASYPPLEERWKCKFCHFSSVCPVNSKSKS